jgi:hypothetical protein
MSASSQKTEIAPLRPIILRAFEVLLSTLVATGSATWTARGILADYDRRIAVLESEQANQTQLIADVHGDLSQLRDWTKGTK